MTKKKTKKNMPPKKKKTSAIRIKTSSKKNMDAVSELDPKELAAIEKKIKIIVAEILGIPQNKITKKTHFVHDLGMDSMKALEILAAFERLFKVQVDEASLEKMVSLEEIMKMVETLLAKQKSKKKKSTK